MESNDKNGTLFIRWLPLISLVFGVAGAWGTAQIKQATLQAQMDETIRRANALELQVRDSATKADLNRDTERVLRELDQMHKSLDLLTQYQERNRR